MDFLTGTKVLEEADSPVNGRIKVVKSLGFGTYIQVDGLTQSGGVVYEVWRTVLRKVKSQNSRVKSCLILGLGGGSAAKLIKKFWPEAKVTGVDIDPLMVKLGQKYLGLPDIKIVIEDAEKFLLNISHRPLAIKYDLILVDTYLGDEFPKKFESLNYIHLVRILLTREGMAVFNRLYFAEKRPQAMKFGEKLEKIFSKVDCIYPEANVMFVCKK